LHRNGFIHGAGLRGALGRLAGSLEAAEIDEDAGNLQSARLHRDVSRATILRLANSLPAEEPLRQIFLSAPAVARILNRGS